MKNFGAFLLILLAFGWAFWMSAQIPKPQGFPGEEMADGGGPEDAIPRPPEGGGPAAYLEYAYQLQTATAEPRLRATQQAQMTAGVLEQHIYTDGLTATAALALTQQSLNLTATPVSLTATAQREGTQAAAQLTQQALLDQHLNQTATEGIAATRLAQTQLAPLIQAQADAARNQSYFRLMLAGLLALGLAVSFLFAVVHYAEYLADRRTKRRDASIRARIILREGASPLFMTKDERPIDPDKAFHPDATQPAPSVEHQERVTQRAQAIKMAHEVARGMAASPGTHTQNYLANLAAPWHGGHGLALRQLPPEIQILDAPPPYAGEIENQAIEDGEVIT